MEESSRAAVEREPEEPVLRVAVELGEAASVAAEQGAAREPARERTPDRAASRGDPERDLALTAAARRTPHTLVALDACCAAAAR